jgi:hypothetical protein
MLLIVVMISGHGNEGIIVVLMLLVHWASGDRSTTSNTRTLSPPSRQHNTTAKSPLQKLRPDLSPNLTKNTPSVLMEGCGLYGARIKEIHAELS